MKIRRARVTDFESIYNFINELENTVFGEEHQREIFTENLSNPRNFYLLATINEETVGFLSCHVQPLLHHGGLVGEIQEMYVSTDQRGLGIGQKLVDDLKRRAKEASIIQLEVTSNLLREKAHRFYKNQSFDHTHSKFVLKLD